MKRTQQASSIAARILSVIGLLAVAIFSSACEGEGVGDPCIPEDEYREGFSGYSKDEVNVESRSFQCETRVCLVNKFQGRVSCPYGQNDADEATDGFQAPGAGGKRCYTPDGTLPINVAVPPQLVDRSPDDSVYCSCRCDGPQDNAPYCPCPKGFKCTNLIDDIGLGNKQLAGSYCVKNGTEKKSGSIRTAPCENGNCDERVLE